MKITENHTFVTEQKTTEGAKFEQHLLSIENEIRHKLELKNTIESKSYEYKRRVDEDIKEYTTEPLRNQIATKCDELVNWVYGDGEDATVKE